MSSNNQVLHPESGWWFSCCLVRLAGHVIADRKSDSVLQGNVTKDIFSRFSLLVSGLSSLRCERGPWPPPGTLLRGGGVMDWIKTLLCLSRQRRSFRCECDSAARFSPLNGAMRRMHAWLRAAAGPALPGPASGCIGAMQLGETGCTSTVGGVRLREESKSPH